jgi:hypothetical protein
LAGAGAWVALGADDALAFGAGVAATGVTVGYWYVWLVCCIVDSFYAGAASELRLPRVKECFGVRPRLPARPGGGAVSRWC